MARTKQGTCGNGRNRWNYEQRVCLHLLWTHKRNPPLDERARVFNGIYKDQLAACGVRPPGLKPETINAQPSWMRTWGNVRDAPDTGEDRAFRARLAAQIDAVLQQGGGRRDVVVLDTKTPPETPRRTHRVRTASQDSFTAYTFDDPAFGDTVDTTIDVAASPETPRRTGRARKPAQNPYTAYTVDDPSTPNQSQGVSAHVSADFEPYATPGPSFRKRPAAVAAHLLVDSDNDDSVDEMYDDFNVPRAKRVMRSSPTVVVPPSPPETAAIRTFQTPSRRPHATMLFHRLAGGPIWLTPAEYAEAMEPLVNVTEGAAHPNPPALLFRYWHRTKSHGINSEAGFVSGRTSRNLVEERGPPDCDVLNWNDVGHHLNNAGNDQNAPPSPFISTSNLFVWVLRMALKRADDSAYISVIDTSKMDPKSIYHVPPFYEALKKKKVFFKGGFMYRGSYEHLIWDRIPESAMVKTFSLRDIISFAEDHKLVKRVLRLDQLAMVKTSAGEIVKAFKENDVRIGGRVAAAIAKLVIFLGLDHTSSRDTLSRAVHEIAQGWVLKADGRSQDQAKHFVGVFTAKMFADTGKASISRSEYSKLEHAFLHGIQWSCGALNVHLKGPAGYQEMEKNASKLGLTDPGKFLANVLIQEGREINRFEMQQQRLHTRPRGRLAIEEQRGEPEGQLGEDAAEDLVPRRLGRLNLQEFIRYK